MPSSIQYLRYPLTNGSVLSRSFVSATTSSSTCLFASLVLGSLLFGYTSIVTMLHIPTPSQAFGSLRGIRHPHHLQQSLEGHKGSATATEPATNTENGFDPSIRHLPRPKYLGPRDRFWKHIHKSQTLEVNGKNYYHIMKECMAEGLTADDYTALNHPSTKRVVGKSAEERFGGRIGLTFMVQVLDALTKAEIKAILRLSHCIATEMHLQEKRPLHLEMGVLKDPGYTMGGNSPTHMWPMLGVYLPTVVDTIFDTIRQAYDYAGWDWLTLHDELEMLDESKEDGQDYLQSAYRAEYMPHPDNMGVRASETLHNKDFNHLNPHIDGAESALTFNCPLSDPTEYEGGSLYIIQKNGQKTYIKPEKYSCIIFMGGMYKHGVADILSGNREIFSTELWYHPDMPAGTNLWQASADSMEQYIEGCNAVGHVAGEGPCSFPFPED